MAKTLVAIAYLCNKHSFFIVKYFYFMFHIFLMFTFVSVSICAFLGYIAGSWPTAFS